MALIERQFAQVASYDVDPDTLTIKEGMLIAMNGAAGARRATTGDATKIIGIAGDTNSTSASAMPGISSGWQNRASDGYNETRASGKVSVYYGMGEYYTDQFTQDGNLTNANVGKFLKAEESTGKFVYDGATKTTSSIAQLLAAPASIESGIPGTDVNGSTALGGDNSNTYILIKLLI